METVALRHFKFESTDDAVGQLSVVFELPSGTLAVADVACTMRGLFDLVETESLFLFNAFSYFPTLISGRTIVFITLKQFRASLVLPELKWQKICLLIYMADRNKWLRPQN